MVSRFGPPVFQFSPSEPTKVHVGLGTPTKPGKADPYVGPDPHGEDMVEAGPKLLRGLLEVFILESLEQAPKHGYALLKEMSEAFGAEPNRNRLYPLLGRMVRDGYVREASEGSGTRTLYVLTESGHDALETYRRIPGPFRQALRRIWSVDAAAPPRPPAPPVEPAPAGAVATPRHIPVQASPGPLSGPAPPRGALPYPCPDARVAAEKSPATGDLQLRITGCPMGAYDYCPECPVFKGVEGMRRLTFGL